ncbi:MAG TPA: hypothetical protein ENL20_11790 [Candidatus Cloacimonetes bacterium]|nr:hypothetical protein [Candidatus Cloacimonadota bacterium]
MKKLLFLVMLFLLTQVLIGDWDPEDPAKWVQMPDQTNTGIDIRFDQGDGINRTLGDDFLCTTTELITDIHLWCSWRWDYLADINGFKISIWSDMPAGHPNNEFPWSHPETLLWERIFQPGDWIERVYYQLQEGYEWWWDPYSGELDQMGDQIIWQYNFFIDQAEAFMQEGTTEQPVIYWLVVETDIQAWEGESFGWKTRDIEDGHFMDDAVYLVDPINNHWEEMRYPLGHPYEMLSIDLAFVITGEDEPTDEYDLGDAPEGEMKIAYPSTGVTGYFPTCITVLPSGYVIHGPAPLSSYFGPSVDLESDGNADGCPTCFPIYDDDECYGDGDAGLIIPDSYTIDAAVNVVPCPSSIGTSLGFPCATAVWGTDIDIDVQNLSTADRFVNVLFDWNQNGYWQDDPGTTCFGAMTPEHVLINFGIPAGYTGPLSGLNPPDFIIGPNSGYFWSRFTISDIPVTAGEWDGSGEFGDGETEDYLLFVEEEPQEELDFGDAPDPTYPTLLANDGARHTVVAGVYMGALIDAEPNGLQDPNAMGDDNNNLADEDGINFLGQIIPGENVQVLINVSTNGFINAWLDYNIDGGWAEANDLILNNQPVTAGNNTFNISVPITATPGITFTRFRFDTVGGLSYIGLANDGEVEDYKIKIEELDFGDADDPLYPTYYVNNGARHVIDGLHYLGTSVDSDADGQPDGLATGDDNDGNDDEDGVLFITPLIPGEQGAVYVQANTTGYLNAWIDYDQNGSWDATEQIFTDVVINNVWTPHTFMIPSSASFGQTTARFRFDSAGGLAATGLAADGEVEDYLIIIEEAPDDGSKMHYHQWPDTTMFGIDVSASQDEQTTRLIADDFLCLETGPINSIHIWGSWWYDEWFPDPFFELAIWSDNPMGGQGWSEPDQMLWMRDFMPGEYNYDMYAQVPDGEHWYDPCTGNLIFPGDWTVFEYDFTIPDVDAFMQEEGTIYWLSVRQFGTPGSAFFGWKTSPNHWNDDAVYQCFPPGGMWTEMIYPMGHPFNPFGEEHISMDMAFYIDCEPQTPQNITITEDGVNVYLQWDPSWCADYYNVYSSTDPYAAFPSGWTLEPTGTQIPGTSWSEALGSMKFYRVTAER